jgi:hypothetical protein
VVRNQARYNHNDDYDDYDDSDDSEGGDVDGEPREAAPAVRTDDDTAEFEPVQLDGQEELPLNERINGRGDPAEGISLDEPLGARGEGR